jgi:uncharacterized protein
MMQINVSQLLKSSVGSEREYELSDPIDINEEGDKNSVEGVVKLTRTNRGILAKGTFRTKIRIECSRCLSQFDFPLTVDVEEEFLPLIDVVSGFALPLPEEPGYFTIDERHILDLTEVVRQNALLALPMKPLCREDCSGLCLECGRDLNEGACDCNKQEIDPRWTKLVQLASAGNKSNKKRKE